MRIVFNWWLYLSRFWWQVRVRGRGMGRGGVGVRVRVRVGVRVRPLTTSRASGCRSESALT